MLSYLHKSSLQKLLIYKQYYNYGRILHNGGISQWPLSKCCKPRISLNKYTPKQSSLFGFTLLSSFSPAVALRFLSSVVLLLRNILPSFLLTSSSAGVKLIYCRMTYSISLLSVSSRRHSSEKFATQWTDRSFLTLEINKKVFWPFVARTKLVLSNKL